MKSRHKTTVLQSKYDVLQKENGEYKVLSSLGTPVALVTTLKEAKKYIRMLEDKTLLIVEIPNENENTKSVL